MKDSLYQDSDFHHAAEKPDTGSRIASMILDHVIMTFVAMLFFTPGLVAGILQTMEISHEPASFMVFGAWVYPALLGFALYFCKDSIGGRSVAKRALKLQVVENESGAIASPLRCFVRNLFAVLWPVEVIMTLINPERRIGDLVAGTRVVRFNPDAHQPRFSLAGTGLSIALAYGIMLTLFIPVQKLAAKMEVPVAMYVETSLNKTAGTEMQQLFNDSLGEHLIADVRVYDQIKQDSNMKYVSVIFHLKENYLQDEARLERLRSRILPLLFSRFSEGSFAGQIQYVYRQPGYSQTRREQIGRPDFSVNTKIQ